VIWPKDATLNVMLKADFAAGIRTAQGLVDTELNNKDTNSSNSSTGGSGSQAVSMVVDYYCSIVIPPAAANIRFPGFDYLPQQLPSSDKLPQVLALCCRLGGQLMHCARSAH
jgi:hypothetical protein